MAVKNQLWNDARVKKEARCLRGAGFQVTIVAKPEDGFGEDETERDIRILRPRKDSRRRERLRKKAVRASEQPSRSCRARILTAIRRNRLRRTLTDWKRNLPWEYRLYRAILSTGADIVHANDLDTLLICSAAARKLGAKLVYDSHELWLESSRFLSATSPLNRLRFRLTEKRLIYGADAVIAVTPSRGEAMLSMYPGLKRMVIIENSSIPVADLPSSRYLRDRLDLPDSTVVALYQGVICPERGLEELVNAAQILKNERIAIVIMGHDSWSGTLERIAGEADLEGILFLVPPVPSEDLLEITVSADIGLILFQNTCLNHFYSLPNKLYEYMMAGLPVIASNFPEMSRIITENRSGLLIDASSPEEIADAIGTLAANRSEARSMGQRGRIAVLEKYNWLEQEKKLITLYEELQRE